MEGREPHKTPPLWKRLFPPRQIYFRTHGEVRFIALSPALQQTAAVLGMAALLWVTFASAQVLMEDEIMAAKDQRISVLKQQNQAREADLSRLQSEVLRRAEALEERQQYLQSLMEMDPTGRIERPGLPPVYGPPAEAREDGATTPDRGASAADPGGAGLLIRAASADGPAPADEFEAFIARRLARIEGGQQVTAGALAEFAATRLTEADDMLAPFKLKAADLARVSALEEEDFTAQGGPFIPFEDRAKAADSAPPAVFASLHERWMQMLRVYAGLKSIPLNTPLEDFYISSNFGRRTDPITKQPGWHPGIDLAGWPGTRISTPNAGTVSKAGVWGSYGKMVEIDHGNGFSTRYGHLRKVTVNRGQRLSAGDVIGEMGCTGRCTDTHLHYEVIFNGKLRNPKPFLEAPQDVQQKQRQAGTGDG